MYAEVGDVFDLNENSSQSAFVLHLLWLVPLAEVLQQHSKLYQLVPVAHHAVLELQFTRGSHQPCFILYAPEAGKFQVKFLTGLIVDEANNVLIGEGDAQLVAQLLEEAASRAERLIPGGMNGKELDV